MKRVYIFSMIFIVSNCGHSSVNNANSAKDSIGLTNPSAIDTIKHPSGMDNSSAISTDTAAMNVQNTIKKADSINKKNSK